MSPHDDLTILHCLDRHAHAIPSETAFRYLKDGETETDSVTFSQLQRDARFIAQSIVRAGLSGRVIVLAIPHDLEFIRTFFACLYARAIPVAVPQVRNRRSVQLLQSLLKCTPAAAILSTPEVLTTISKSNINDKQFTLIDIKEITHDSSESSELPEPTDRDVAFLQFTSGSLSSPRGIVISHANLMHNQLSINSAFGHNRKTIVGGWLPLNHDMGLIGLVMQPVYLGVPCVLMPPAAFTFKPRRWLSMITRYGISSSGGPSFAYDLCADKIRTDELVGLDLSSWRVAFNGAEPVSAKVIRRFSSAFSTAGFKPSAMYPCYGMAEATLFVSGGSSGRSPVYDRIKDDSIRVGLAVEAGTEDVTAVDMVSCGYTWNGTEIRIVDSSSGTALGDGQIGEIWVSGAGISSHYLTEDGVAPVSTGFIQGLEDAPYLKTGDLGYLRNGELFVTGRAKELIVIRGQNYYPSDLESTAEAATTGLRKNANVVFQSEERPDRLIVVQEISRSNGPADKPFAERKIREAIAFFHGLTVDRVILVSPGTIPRTSSGKRQRLACEKQYNDGNIRPVGQLERSASLSQ